MRKILSDLTKEKMYPTNNTRRVKLLIHFRNNPKKRNGFPRPPSKNLRQRRKNRFSFSKDRENGIVRPQKLILIAEIHFPKRKPVENGYFFDFFISKPKSSVPTGTLPYSHGLSCTHWYSPVLSWIFTPFL